MRGSVSCGAGGFREIGEKIQGDFVLQGIAVNLDETRSFARRGIGSRMLAVFEQKVREMGYAGVSVGSADDARVEHFYVKNGYAPLELVALDEAFNELCRLRTTGNYDETMEEKERLRERYRAKQVIVIFAKKL